MNGHRSRQKNEINVQLVHFKLNSNLSLKPSVLIRKVTNQPITSEFLGMLNIGGFFEIGASYRTTKSVGLMSFVGIKNYLDIGYAYEAPTNTSLLNQSIKTNEFFLRIKINKSEKKDPPKKKNDESL